MVSLEKKSPPGLLSLAKKAHVVLEKKGMGAHTASVGLCMDISGSMSPLFQNGTVQAVIERTLGLGLNFDDNGAIDLFAFGVQAHDLGELHPEQFKQASSDLLQRVSLEPGTMYAPPIQQIIKHYGFQPQAGFFKSLFGGKAKEAPRANELPFPLNIRQTLYVWKALFLDQTPFQPDPTLTQHRPRDEGLEKVVQPG